MLRQMMSKSDKVMERFNCLFYPFSVKKLVDLMTKQRTGIDLNIGTIAAAAEFSQC